MPEERRRHGCIPKCSTRVFTGGYFEACSRRERFIPLAESFPSLVVNDRTETSAGAIAEADSAGVAAIGADRRDVIHLEGFAGESGGASRVARTQDIQHISAIHGEIH